MHKPNFTILTVKDETSYGQFVIEPLENGFGHTLGNALRRVLLGSFEGAAITAVKVAGVTHKFSTLEGLSEDMVDLILNLKSIKVSYEGEGEVTAKIKVSGPKVVTAASIIAPAGVKVINGDAVIARLASGAKLDMELTIGRGFGYSPAEERSSDTLGVIVIDSIFSPVERVSYKVESTRVGRRTDYDKLVMDIYTDGSLAPADALKKAGEILVEYFSQVVNPVVSDPDSVVPPLSSAVLIEELGLATRITNALKNGGYKTALELAKATDKDLKNVKNLGGKSLGLIDQALEEKGFKRNK